MGLDLPKVRLVVEEICGSNPDVVTIGRLPTSASARKAFEYAMEEARSLNHNYIDTEHLLLGLLRQPYCDAMLVLHALDLDGCAVRQNVLSLLGRVPH
jgi:ATP-dependent Clp protease ATP-binding subunit ClpC